MANENKIPDFLKMAEDLKRDLIRYASVTGVNFFVDSFQNQGFTDESFEAWPVRKNDVDPGRKILVKSAFLINSIQVYDANDQRITFGSDSEYAEIHNEGGTVSIKITQKSRKYFWFMYMNTRNEMWKALALTKKETITMIIPKRQFIGHSQTLMNDLDKWLVNQILTRFKNYVPK